VRKIGRLVEDSTDLNKREGCYRAIVKRILLSLAIGYLVIALVTRAQEAAGVMRCDCSPDCWCKKPGLSLFRWVFPRFHKILPAREI